MNLYIVFTVALNKKNTSQKPISRGQAFFSIKFEMACKLFNSSSYLAIETEIQVITLIVRTEGTM